MRILALVGLGAAGCAPGQLEWGTGDDLIRTALYTTQDEDTTTHAVILLSNGIFECTIDDGPDPAENEDARGERCYAAYREDARHVVLHLWYPRGAEPVGLFPGDSDAAPGGELSETPPRWSRAAYLAIEEVVNNSGDDLVQDEFEITSVEVWGASVDLSAFGIGGEFHTEPLGDGGTAAIDRSSDDALGGSFSYPAARISGDFRAGFCPWDAPTGLSVFRYLDIVDYAGRINEQWQSPPTDCY